MSWDHPTVAGLSEKPDVFGDLAKASTAQTARGAADSTTTGPPTRTGPTDRGERLGTFERGDSEELRVCWDEFKGHPYVSLRVWTKNTRGDWWPDRSRGCSIRIRELEGFATSIQKAMALDAATSDGRGGDHA